MKATQPGPCPELTPLQAATGPGPTSTAISVLSWDLCLQGITGNADLKTRPRCGAGLWAHPGSCLGSYVTQGGNLTVSAPSAVGEWEGGSVPLPSDATSLPSWIPRPKLGFLCFPNWRSLWLLPSPAPSRDAA